MTASTVPGPEREVAPARVLALAHGDIERIPADAIVNAANDSLLAGGGVDGAIHRAGGPAIAADLEKRYGRRRRCAPGSAVISLAGELPARWVIHAVGPVWRGGGVGEPERLASAYATALQLADEHGARTVTFPAISTGVYRYPPTNAAAVAVQTLMAGLTRTASVERATIVLYSVEMLAVFTEALDRSVWLAPPPVTEGVPPVRPRRR